MCEGRLFLSCQGHNIWWEPEQLYHYEMSSCLEYNWSYAKQKQKQWFDWVEVDWDDNNGNVYTVPAALDLWGQTVLCNKGLSMSINIAASQLQQHEVSMAY